MCTRVVALGNPGSGKSTILNTAVGSPFFKAGMSPGHGIMPDLQEKQKGRFKFVDTPGLADPRLRENAAKYISSTLSQGGPVKLIFVMKCDDLRVAAQDLRTMNLVLEKLQEAGCKVHESYTIVLNQMFRTEIESVKSGIPEAQKMFSSLCTKYRTSHITTFPLDLTAKGRENAILSFREKVLECVEKAPTLHIRRDTPITLSSMESERLEELFEKRRRQDELVSQQEITHKKKTAEMKRQESVLKHKRIAEEDARTEARKQLQVQGLHLQQSIRELETAKQYRKEKIRRRAKRAAKALAFGTAAGLAAGFLF